MNLAIILLNISDTLSNWFLYIGCACGLCMYVIIYRPIIVYNIITSYMFVFFKLNAMVSHLLLPEDKGKNTKAVFCIFLIQSFLYFSYG